MTTPNIEPEAGTRKAPGTLELVKSLANTVDVESGTDALQSPDGDVARGRELAREWLIGQGLWPTDGPELLMPDYIRLGTFRDAVRQLLSANHGGEEDPGATSLVNERLATGPLRVVLDGGRARLVPAGEGVDAVLATYAAAIYDAMAAGTWPRLKICGAGDCQWAFYDTSKNRSGAWCSMAVCGNRAKVRKYQARQKARLAALDG